MTAATTPPSPGPPAGPPRRRHVARWIALAVASVLVALGVVLALQVGGDEASGQKARIGLVDQPAPDFDLPTLDGGRVALADLAGKVVIVNFWNSWCIPCKQEHPALVEFYDRHRDDSDLVMIGIVRDDTEKAAREYVEEQGDDWVMALDPGSRAALDFGTFGQPETYAISPDGVIVGLQLGPVTVADLEAMLARARGVA